MHMYVMFVNIVMVNHLSTSRQRGDWRGACACRRRPCLPAAEFTSDGGDGKLNSSTQTQPASAKSAKSGPCDSGGWAAKMNAHAAAGGWSTCAVGRGRSSRVNKRGG